MALSQKRSLRKPTGGRYKRTKGKRKHELGMSPRLTHIGAKRLKTMRVAGGNEKLMLLSAEVVNVFDQKTKKAMVLKMKTVVENPANRHYVRKNVLTKGTIVDTEKGKVRITNRPGQEGVVNGVFV